MEYVVIRSFTDKDTQEHYEAGDRYPRFGFVSDERIKELSSINNRRGAVLIKPAEEKVEKKVEIEDVKVEIPDEPVKKEKRKKK